MTCSVWPCTNAASWIAEEGKGYCDRCWRKLGRYQWYHDPELYSNQAELSSEGFLMEEWSLRVEPTPPSQNPCVNLFGPGPEDKQCKDCIHLGSYTQSRTWHKCTLCKNTHGASTDHRVKSCARFEERGTNQ